MPTEQRERILAEFAASGMNAVAFAALVGVKYFTFAGRDHLGRPGRKPMPVGRPQREPVAPLRFVETQSPPLGKRHPARREQDVPHASLGGVGGGEQGIRLGNCV